ncbi:MAG: signal peptidase II [Calditrichaceae bacterium]
MYKKISLTFMAVTIICIVILDQVTKLITKTSMYLGESIPVIGNFFRFTYVENPGIAFGVRIGNPVVFMGLSFFAAGLVFYYLYRFRNEGWPVQLSLSFISAGAIGNLVDRVIYGRVIDFMDFEFFDINIPPFSLLSYQFQGYGMDRWPVFNVADMAVTGGMILLLFYMLFLPNPVTSYQKTISESSNG